MLAVLGKLASRLPSVTSLGTRAGFQAFFGADIAMDKSDAGLAKAFKKIDLDGSGTLSTSELRTYILEVKQAS